MKKNDLSKLAGHMLAKLHTKGILSDREAEDLRVFMDAEEPFSMPSSTFAPEWCSDGSMSLAQASGGEKSEEVIDFSGWMLGSFKVRLELMFQDDGTGYIALDWSASEPNPYGWWIAFYPFDDDTHDEPLVTLDLGMEQSGHVLLFMEDLGHDPASTPMKYLVFPQIP